MEVVSPTLRRMIRKRKAPPPIMFIAIALVLLASLSAAVFFYYQYRKASKTSENVSLLIEEVSKIMYLPEETPTVATVTDPSALEGQEFFANAQKGDRVLVYIEAEKAVLYRPSEHKIVEVGPFILPQQP